ncbi:hypothetical protein SANTM175S_01514 [Streptomyces antimycoticus]
MGDGRSWEEALTHLGKDGAAIEELTARVSGCRAR